MICALNSQYRTYYQYNMPDTIDVIKMLIKINKLPQTC